MNPDIMLCRPWPRFFTSFTAALSMSTDNSPRKSRVLLNCFSELHQILFLIQRPTSSSTNGYTRRPVREKTYVHGLVCGCETHRLIRMRLPITEASRAFLVHYEALICCESFGVMCGTSFSTRRKAHVA